MIIFTVGWVKISSEGSGGQKALHVQCVRCRMGLKNARPRVGQEFVAVHHGREA